MRPDFNKMELIPAIVQDYQTKEVLMLAYVNEEAYQRMLHYNLMHMDPLQENRENCL